MTEDKSHGLDYGINKLRDLIQTKHSVEDLKKFATSSDAEEVVFNFLDINKNKNLTEQQRNSLVTVAKQRMEHLKSNFSTRGGGRNMPGKMEYDTIKDALDDFNK